VQHLDASVATLHSAKDGMLLDVYVPPTGSRGPGHWAALYLCTHHVPAPGNSTCLDRQTRAPVQWWGLQQRLGGVLPPCLGLSTHTVPLQDPTPPVQVLQCGSASHTMLLINHLDTLML
jgi:hypothetical protein